MSSVGECVFDEASVFPASVGTPLIIYVEKKSNRWTDQTLYPHRRVVLKLVTRRGKVPSRLLTSGRTGRRSPEITAVIIEVTTAVVRYRIRVSKVRIHTSCDEEHESEVQSNPFIIPPDAPGPPHDDSVTDQILQASFSSEHSPP